MKTIGIIAEYNPFHNGHAYHIRQAKTVSGADTCVVIMSGNFVQRGAPAIADKYTRARMALSCGADLVLELPVCYSCASAEYFAQGAVSLLNQIGITDGLCFGSESGDLDSLKALAHILSDESDEFSSALKAELRQGKNFAMARNDALISCMMKKQVHFSAIQNIYTLTDALSSPNNILGIEYLKALLTQESSIVPYTIRREGADYHSQELHGTLSSAAALRTLLRTASTPQILNNFMPDPAYSLMEKVFRKTSPVSEDDFSDLLNYRLLSEQNPDLYGDMTPEMAGRILNEQGAFHDFSGWTDLLKTKQYTRTRVSRSLMQCLLGISRKDLSEFKAAGYTGYARILGFRKERTDVLRAIKEKSRIPLISKLADAESFLPPLWKKQLKLDLHAADLYRLAVYSRYRSSLPNEYRQQIVIVEGEKDLG